MSNIVKFYKGKEARASSKLIAKGFERRHRAVTDLIEKYQDRFNRWGVLPFETVKPDGTYGGRPFKEYYLNEDQVYFLGTLFRNSEITLDFKERLVEEFRIARNKLAALEKEKSRPEYPKIRKSSKILRKQETDAIKAFVEYAESQGSEHADKYYIVLSKMENSALFITEQKFPNLRNVMSVEQLMIIGAADGIVSRAIYEGMGQKMFYKDIYQLAKERILQFADLHGKMEVVIKQLELF